MSEVATGPGWELHCGKWQDVLQGVCPEALICDPPYGERCHSGQRHGRRDPNAKDGTWANARGISYEHLTAYDLHGLIDHWAVHTYGWMCIFTSHDLVPAYEQALEKHRRYVFAPVACVQIGMNVRLAGDGPSNWNTPLVVSRTRQRAKWRTLPGAYVGHPFDGGMNMLDRSKRAVVGQKPLWLMRAIIRDYTNPGDLICDPYAGGGTTLLAAVIEGRRAIGAEMDPKTFAKSAKRLQAGYTPQLRFGSTGGEQLEL